MFWSVPLVHLCGILEESFDRDLGFRRTIRSQNALFVATLILTNICLILPLLVDRSLLIWLCFLDIMIPNEHRNIKLKIIYLPVELS